MRTGVLPLLLFGVVAASPLYERTPFGHVLAHCLHEVPNGAVSREMANGTTQVTAPDGTVIYIPKCDTRGGLDAVLLRTDPSVMTAHADGLPPDYDGWLQYTALNVTRLGLQSGFDAFTNVMSVPDKPKRAAQMLYFFPGLQNRDWIPKVDPEPTSSTPFDIVQPVLQYSASLFGSGAWAVKSWYVTVNAGALYSKAISVEAGDAILCNMTRTGPTSWLVSAALKSDPSKTTVQTANHERLRLQPWAYNTVECYGCDGCDTYPTQSITFTDNKLYQNGQLLDVPGDLWAINPKPAEKLECQERTHVAANGDTTVSFQSSRLVV